MQPEAFEQKLETLQASIDFPGIIDAMESDSTL